MPSKDREAKRAYNRKRYADPRVSAATKEATRAWRAANPDAALAASQKAVLVNRVRKASPTAPVASELDRLVLTEAVHLARMRTRMRVLGLEWEVDHIKAISLGGTNAALNLQVVPSAWNRAKHNRHAERFLGAKG